MVDKVSKRTRSQIMSKIRSTNTKAEVGLRKALWKKGLRYKLHYGIAGKPDMVLPKYRIAIFVDGDFWHGYNWKVRHKIPPKGYWQKKITRTIKRDKINTKTLRKEGWKVLRFWEHSVEKDLDQCVKLVLKSLNSGNIYKTKRV